MSRPTIDQRQEMAWGLYAAHALQAELQSGKQRSGLDPASRAAAYEMLKERQE